ncbi:MerR family transcriptional regulator [Sulfobacillus thermosulfidooxidans]|uniref:MerR family transcriptional regulator n=1 Tax=Sulfobacillus thermosulfidooxidans TaxID=28034 RepID=UPI001112B3A3|nr:MerR family transcriptional regulator [Sulfobacillus thermosulfidooxidans]
MTLYTIGILSERSGVPVKTIRYYSNRGLLPPAAISPAGYRLYSDQELQQLYRIVALRRLGASLKQIREFVHQDISLNDVLDRQLAAISQQVDTLHQLHRQIQGLQELQGNNDDADHVLHDFWSSDAVPLATAPRMVRRMVTPAIKSSSLVT